MKTEYRYIACAVANSMERHKAKRRIPMFDCYYKNKDASLKIAEVLARYLKGRIPIFLCLGTSKLHYDSLGCRVGSLLETSPYTVYGILTHNIDASNVIPASNFVRIMHPNKPIIAVDAACGGMNDIGKISVSAKGLLPGSANNLNLASVGDISITAVLSTNSLADFYLTPDHMRRFSQNVAEVIADAVLNLEIL